MFSSDLIKSVSTVMVHYSTIIYKREMNRTLTNSLKTLLLLLLEQTSGGEQPSEENLRAFCV